MKNHAKVGNRQGRPAYRTSSAFLHKRTKALRIRSVRKARNKKR